MTTTPDPATTTSRPVAVEAVGLTKRYGGLVALDDLTLQIYEGEIFALLGPNGAGKTTFIGIACGLVRRSAGEIRVSGADVETDYRFTRRRIGLVPQEINFDPFFTVRQILRFQRGYFNLAPDEPALDDLLRALDLWDKRDTNTRALSGGMKRRLLIAKALVHDPPIVFLDEPTAGVDVNLRRDLWDYVRMRRARGTTFILTTHYLEEAEQLADRVGVIDKGRLLLVEGKDDLLQRLGRPTLTVELARAIPLDDELRALGAVISGDGRFVTVEHDRQTDGRIHRLVQALARSGVPIVDLQTATPSLEEIFVKLLKDG